MDDDSCLVKYIEIVPCDNSADCSEIPNFKFSLSPVKVCVKNIFFCLYDYVVNSADGFFCFLKTITNLQGEGDAPTPAYSQVGGVFLGNWLSAHSTS